MMVSRGRGHVSTDRKEQLRRPTVSPLESMAMKIAAFDLASAEELEGIGKEIAKYCVTIDKLKLMVNDLHERSLVSRKFGVKCAVALSTQSQLTIDGKKLRALLMSNIQTDYEDKANLRIHNMNRYLNTFAFIGEVFRHVRLADGEPIAVLAGALIEYSKDLATGTEPEVELMVQQLAYNGKLLKKYHPKDLTKLQLDIRTVSMTPGTDPRCICWMQLAFDLDSFNYQPLSKEWFEFYAARLGFEVLEKINKLLVAPEPEPPSEIEVPASEVLATVADEVLATNGLDLTTVQPEQPAPLPPRQVRETRRVTESTGRVGGAGDAGYGSRTSRGRDPRNDPANWLPRHEPMSEKDQGIWGNNSRRRGNNNSWGHDDRFDKDYNPSATQDNPNNKEESWD